MPTPPSNRNRLNETKSHASAVPTAEAVNSAPAAMRRRFRPNRSLSTPDRTAPTTHPTRAALIAAQRNEITEHHVYRALADRTADPGNREVLSKIADEELGHYNLLKEATGTEVAPDGWALTKHILISRICGLTFGLKLMERGEAGAEEAYGELARSFPGAERISEDEGRHEMALLEMLDEERLKYVGSVVLGLNDALVELTGALAGLTLALQNARLIAMTGLITGIAASFSMAASEYLSTKADDDGAKSPVKAAVYTGIAYVLTVAVLICPYLILANPFVSLAIAVANGIIIILVFTFYVSVARDMPFWRRFGEMAAVSLGVAALSFGIGYLVRITLGTEA